MIKRIKLVSTFILSTLTLTACSSFNFFEKDNTPTPTPLTAYKADISPQLLWSASVGASAKGDDYLKMAPSVSDAAIYTASSNGNVTSINKTSGNINWQTSSGLSLSTGPGVGNDLVVVANQNGNIVALQQIDGKRRWKTSIDGAVLAKPAIHGGVVVIKAIDGNTYGLSTNDGHVLWSFKQPEPNFILRGSSSPLIHDRSVIVGYASGNLAKLSLNDGQLMWQQTVAVPQGAFAIQRMIDIDANPITFERHIYVATYQGNISSLDWDSGRTLWTHDISSYTGMSADAGNVFVSDAQGYVWSFNAASGLVNWRQNKLEYRLISGPASMGNYIVVGDAEGYLHWLSKQDGHFSARVALGSAIYAAPIVENNVLYALTNTGYLAAYKLR